MTYKMPDFADSPQRVEPTNVVDHLINHTPPALAYLALAGLATFFLPLQVVSIAAERLRLGK